MSHGKFTMDSFPTLADIRARAKLEKRQQLDREQLLESERAEQVREIHRQAEEEDRWRMECAVDSALAGSGIVLSPEWKAFMIDFGLNIKRARLST